MPRLRRGSRRFESYRNHNYKGRGPVDIGDGLQNRLNGFDSHSSLKSIPGVMELVDMHDLGSCAKAYGFDSLHPDKNAALV